MINSFKVVKWRKTYTSKKNKQRKTMTPKKYGRKEEIWLYLNRDFYQRLFIDRFRITSTKRLCFTNYFLSILLLLLVFVLLLLLSERKYLLFKHHTPPPPPPSHSSEEECAIKVCTSNEFHNYDTGCESFSFTRRTTKKH